MEKQNKEAQTTSSQISIEKYLAALEIKRKQTLSAREISKAKIPLSYEQFKKLIIAHGSNCLAERGEENIFRIDEYNEPAICQLYCYFTGNKQFKGSLSKGILLNGSYGSGKTVLMKSIQRVHNDCSVHWKKNGITVTPMRMFKSSDIVDAFRFEANRGKSDQAEIPKIDITKKNYMQGIIIIDELGREQKEINVWGTIIQPLSQIIQERYDIGFPTFATANFKVDTLSQEEHYGKMVGDRLRQMFNEITLIGDSRRK